MMQFSKHVGSLGRAVAICAFSLMAPANAQEGYALWAKTWTSAYPDAMTLNPSGQLVIASSSTFSRFDHFDTGGRLVKTNTYAGAFLADLAFDQAGNQYAAGTIDTNVNGYFDPSQVHGFAVAKFDPQDQLIWVRSQNVEDPQWSAQAQALAVDAFGNVVVAGYAKGPVGFGTNSFGDGEGPVILKYDASGSLLWAKRIDCSFTGGAGGGINKLAIDPTGHIVLCGFLSPGTADFGGTPMFPGSTGTAYDGDWFLARYEPNGDLDWVQLGFAKTAVTDRQGNIFVNWGEPVMGTDGIAKLDTNGVVIWSKPFPNLFTVYTARAGGLALDGHDEPVFTGEFSGTAKFGTTTLTARSTTDPDFFVAKADSSGNIQWALSGGGTGYDRGDQVTVDRQGNVFVVGEMNGAGGSFDGFPLPFISNTHGYPTLFVAKISPTPPLKLATSAGALNLWWPLRATNYALEAAISPPSPLWTPITNAPKVTATGRSVQLPITGDAKFFRLRKL